MKHSNDQCMSDPSKEKSNSIGEALSVLFFDTVIKGLDKKGNVILTGSTLQFAFMLQDTLPKSGRHNSWSRK